MCKKNVIDCELRLTVYIINHHPNLGSEIPKLWGGDQLCTFWWLHANIDNVCLKY